MISSSHFCIKLEFCFLSLLDDEVESDEKQEETMNQELVELTSEISLKQKLIEELETSQKRLHIMKQQYETKLLALGMSKRLVQ